MNIISSTEGGADSSRSQAMRAPSENAAAPYEAAYPSDEIDLVDLGVLLWRRRWLMLVVFTVFLALTIVGTIIKRPTYQYTQSLQLGSLTSTQGGLIFPLSPDAAVSALENGYVPDAMVKYQASHKVDLKRLKVAVNAGAANAGQAGSIVTLSCKVHEDLAQACVAVEQGAATAFIRDNSRSIDAARSDLQAKLDSAKLNLAAAQNPDVFGVQKLAAEQAITTARNNLRSLVAEAQVLEVRKSKLAASAALYERQSAQLEEHIADARKAAIAAGGGTMNATNAMSNLVLSTEVQQNVNLLSTIQQNLAVKIPEQSATVEKNLSDNARSQALQQQVIAQNETALKKLEFDHGQDIQTQQIAVQNLQSQISNVVDNRLLGEPLRSFNPVGLGRGAVFGIGFILSIILAFLAAFVASYFDQVRARLAIDTHAGR